jgi:hypothetical protein
MADLPTITYTAGAVDGATTGTVQTVSQITDRLGEVQASPTANTLLERVKVLNTSIQQLVTALGSTALDLGSGTGGTRTIRTILDSSQLGSDPTKAEDAIAASGDVGIPAYGVQVAAPADTAADGDWSWLQIKDGCLLANTAPQNFAAAATTLTRPANQTPYSVGDSVSNHGTAASVTALSATVSDVNDAPVNVTHIELDTNDTGIGAATTTMRVYLYNSDPTASSGVVNGDNGAFSNKKAGLVGTFVGIGIAMSDGGKFICTPEAGAAYLACKPTSGAKTLFVQHQIIGGTPTPSANSTTIDTKICGFQGRA